jgi:hypothetical protein
VRILSGAEGDPRETLVHEAVGKLGYRYRGDVTVIPPKRCYVRVEASTVAAGSYDNQVHRCFTNPIWLDPR